MPNTIVIAMLLATCHNEPFVRSIEHRVYRNLHAESRPISKRYLIDPLTIRLPWRIILVFVHGGCVTRVRVLLISVSIGISPWRRGMSLRIEHRKRLVNEAGEAPGKSCGQQYET